MLATKTFLRCLQASDQYCMVHDWYGCISCCWPTIVNRFPWQTRLTNSFVVIENVIYHHHHVPSCVSSKARFHHSASDTTILFVSNPVLLLIITISHQQEQLSIPALVAKIHQHWYHRCVTVLIIIIAMNLCCQNHFSSSPSSFQHHFNITCNCYQQWVSKSPSSWTIIIVHQHQPFASSFPSSTMLNHRH